MRKIAITATLSLALAGCAGDNPENVPLHGDWEMTTRIKSLTVDGRAVPSGQIPQQVRAIEGSEKRCGEPMFIDQDWQEEDINRRIPGSCAFEQYEVTPTFVSGRGRCSAVVPQAGFDPIFGVMVNQSEQSFRMELILEGSATLPGSNRSAYIRAVAVQEGARLGDC